MAASASNKSSFQPSFYKPSEILAILTAAFALASISFVYGKFLVIGLSYLPLLSIGDHISLGIQGLPSVFSAMLVGGYVGAKAMRDPKSQADLKTSRVKFITRDESMLYIGLFLFVLAMDFAPYSLFGIVGMIWFVGGLRILPTRIFFIKPTWVSLMIAFLPGLLALLIFWGGVSAKTDAIDESNIHQIQIAGGGMVEGNVMVVFSKGIVIQSGKQSVFLSINSIDRVALNTTDWNQSKSIYKTICVFIGSCKDDEIPGDLEDSEGD